MSINYQYRIQIRQGHRRYWQTKYAVDNRAQAVLLYEGVNIGNGWQKRLMHRTGLLARAES